jgi:hypothetical protein
MNHDVALERWLDGSLDEAGHVELLARVTEDPDLARRLADAARMDLVIGIAHRRARDLAPGVLAGLRGQDSKGTLRRSVMCSLPRSLPRSRPRSRRARWPVPGLALAAAAMLAITLILAVRYASPVWEGRIVSAAPGAVLARGAERVPVVDGMALQPGDRLESGAATLGIAAAGARLELVGNLELRSMSALHLASGRLSADVSPRPSDDPLVFITPSARAVVVGTMLDLAVADGVTRLSVGTGKVRISAPDGQGSLAVDAGRSATVAKGGLPQLDPAMQALFPTGLTGWRIRSGTWDVAAGVLCGGSREQRSRIESLASYADFELRLEMRVSGVQAAELQIADYAWFAAVPRGPGWHDIRVSVSGGLHSGSIDGSPIVWEAGRTEGRTDLGPIAFYIMHGGTVEVRKAFILAR